MPATWRCLDVEHKDSHCGLMNYVKSFVLPSAALMCQRRCFLNLPSGQCGAADPRGAQRAPPSTKPQRRPRRPRSWFQPMSAELPKMRYKVCFDSHIASRISIVRLCARTSRDLTPFLKNCISNGRKKSKRGYPSHGCHRDYSFPLG